MNGNFEQRLAALEEHVRRLAAQLIEGQMRGGGPAPAPPPQADLEQITGRLRQLERRVDNLDARLRNMRDLGPVG